MKIAICPGSFDPPTNGHLDIILRAASLFDHLIIGVLHNRQKKPLFTMEERVGVLRQITAGLPNVEVDAYEGLLSDYAIERGAVALVRGLRAVSDFEFEFMLASMNKQLAPQVETVYMMTSNENSFLSSSLVKEVASLGGDVSGMVPGPVLEMLCQRFGRGRV